MVDEYSWAIVSAYMKYIQEAAAQKTRQAIQNIKDDVYYFKDCLDDGSLIKVAIRKIADKLSIDFIDSAPVNKNSLNANKAIVQSALIYILRRVSEEEKELPPLIDLRILPGDYITIHTPGGGGCGG